MAACVVVAAQLVSPSEATAQLACLVREYDCGAVVRISRQGCVRLPVVEESPWRGGLSVHQLLRPEDELTACSQQILANRPDLDAVVLPMLSDGFRS